MMTQIIQNLVKYIFLMCILKIIKAWHIHKKMTLNYVAALEKLKLVLYDDRKKVTLTEKYKKFFFLMKIIC